MLELEDLGLVVTIINKVLVSWKAEVRVQSITCDQDVLRSSLGPLNHVLESV